jgi:hypothetical protein
MNRFKIIDKMQQLPYGYIHALVIQELQNSYVFSPPGEPPADLITARKKLLQMVADRIASNLATSARKNGKSHPYHSDNIDIHLVMITQSAAGVDTTLYHDYLSSLRNNITLHKYEKEEFCLSECNRIIGELGFRLSRVESKDVEHWRNKENRVMLQTAGYFVLAALVGAGFGMFQFSRSNSKETGPSHQATLA